MGEMGIQAIVLYVLFFVGVFYLLFIRPQKKYAKSRETLLSGLQVRDRVITSGGLCGEITAIRKDSIMLLIAEKVEVEVMKTGVMSVEQDDEADDDDENSDGVNLEKDK